MERTTRRKPPRLTDGPLFEAVRRQAARQRRMQEARAYLRRACEGEAAACRADLTGVLTGDELADAVAARTPGLAGYQASRLSGDGKADSVSVSVTV